MNYGEYNKCMMGMTWGRVRYKLIKNGAYFDVKTISTDLKAVLLELSSYSATRPIHSKSTGTSHQHENKSHRMSASLLSS